MTDLTTRRATFTPTSVDADRRTATLMWSTGARVLRRPFLSEPYFEELSLKPGDVDLSRLNGGASVLNSHQRDNLSHVIGTVERAWVENNQAFARVRFSNRDDVAPIWDDVRSGVVRHASVGYMVDCFEDISDKDAQHRTLRATKWTPHELSLVPISADAGCGVRSADFSTEGNSMTEQATDTDTDTRTGAATRTRAQERADTEIRTLCTRVQLPELANTLIARGLDLETARNEIIDALAKREPPATLNINPSITGGHASGFDDPAFTRDATAEAICSRYTGAALSERAKPFAYRRMVDHARAALQAAGHHVGVMSEGSIITRALHSTSDFPDLLVSTGQRLLIDGYQSVPSGIKELALASEARDFRPVTVLRLGPFPTLEKVNEHGEVKSGTIAQTKEAYALATYGRIFGITRQALINDDLSAFSDLARRYGAAVANLEAKILADLIITNPVLDDGVATYHATHANLGTAAAITVTSLGAARQAMRLQKDLDKTTVINLEPRFLLVPAAKETEAQQIIAAITPSKTVDVNPFSGLVLATDPRLDASSATAWYLFASPAVAPVIRYSTLEGNAGPQVETKEGFEIPGISFRVLHDFGAGIVDFRGSFKNPGA